EHNQVIYQKYQGVLGRCIGHGAFPIGISEAATLKYHDVPVVPNLELGQGDAFMNHGYAILDIDGDAAGISYFQDTDEDEAMFSEALERAQAVGG
ncbi:MAG: hypothetical protein ABJC09_10315, partial [Terriglobia bacterium]